MRLLIRAIARLSRRMTSNVTLDPLEPRKLMSVTVSIGDVSLTEPAQGVSAASFPLTLSQASTTDVTIKYKTIAGTAKAGKDFVKKAGFITIPAGQTSQTIDISIIGGVTGNTTKQFTVDLKKATNADIANGVGTGSITDDITPSLSVQSASTPQGNHKLSLAVILSGKDSLPVTAQWSTADGSATAGLDYSAASGKLTFKPRQIIKFIKVPILDNTAQTNNTTFSVNLTSPANATIGQNGTETIVGANGANEIFVDDASINRPKAGYKDLNFKVHLLNPSDGTVSVDYATSPGNNSAGQYVSVAGTIQFLHGQTTSNISVPIIGSTFFEPTMTFYVVLANPNNADIANNIATGTIVNTASPSATPAPTASVNSISYPEGNSGNTPFVFNVSLSSPSTNPVVVYYETQDGTAKDGTDYTGGSGAVYFAPGTTSQNVTVNVLGNTLLEPSKTFDLLLDGATNAYIDTTPGVGTILNDDFPTISVNNTIATAGSEGTTTYAVFAVSLIPGTSAPVSVDYATKDGTAIAGTDYTATTGTLNFTANQTSQTIMVPVIGSDDIKDGGTFFLDLSSPSSTALLGTAEGTATIQKQPSISVADTTADESGASDVPATFTVTLSNPSTQTVTVAYATQDGTAVGGTNYTATSGTLTFAPGVTSLPVSVPVIGQVEDGETFELNLSSPTNATLTNTQATATLNKTPTVSVTDPVVPSGTTGAATANFTVSLSNPSLKTITVHYNTADATATAPTEYTATSGTLTFPAGTTSLNVPVTVNTSPSIEDGSTFDLDLTSPTNATLGASQAVAMFTNAPTISISNASQNEGNSGTTPMAFAVMLSAPSYRTITVDYATEPAPFDPTGASGGVDYTSVSGTLTFSPNQSQQNINVPIIGDTTYEPDEQFNVVLSDPTVATLSNSSAVGTIQNDDPQPFFSISDESVVEGNSGTTNMVFTVSLSNPSYQATSVDYSTSDGTATTADDDYEANSGTLNFAAGQTSQTITVQINGDTNSETDENFFINLTNPTNATLGLGDTGTGTIQNDDGGSVSVNNVYVPESDQNFNPTQALFTVALTNPYTDEVDVKYTTQDGTAVAGTGYTKTCGTLVFEPGQTQQVIAVPVADQFLDSGTQDFSLVLTGVTPGVSIDQATGTATIINDDDQPYLYVSNASVEESSDPSSQQSLQFPVDVYGGFGQPVSFDYTTFDNDGASGGVDYTPVSGTIIFNPGDPSEQFITVPITGGLDPANIESFGLQISNVSGAFLGNGGGAAYGYIYNDNVAPTVSIVPFASMSQNDQSNGGNMAFEVDLNHSYTSDVTVHYTTSNGTASGGIDYTPESDTLTIPAGQTSGFIEIPILNDPDVSGDTQFTVTLDSPTNATLANATSTGNIIDDQNIPGIQVSAESGEVEEGDSDTSYAYFDITLDSPYKDIVTIAYSTADGTATGSNDTTGDYQNASGILTFQPGQLNQTVTVLINGNTTEQSNRYFYLELADPTNATIDSGGGSASETIIDDDEPFISVSNPTIIEPSSGQQMMQFTISLQKPLSYPVNMDYYTSDDAAAAGEQYTAVSGDIADDTGLVFNPGDTSITVDVPILGGASLDGNEDFFLNVLVHDPLNGDQDPVSGVGTIYDDSDPSQTSLSINNASLQPIDSQSSELTFDVYNGGPQASANYQLKFFAIPFFSGGGDFQVEAIDMNTGQPITTLSPLAPGEDQSFDTQVLMVDMNGNPIPAGYYNINIEVSSNGSDDLADTLTFNELPYNNTQVIWTGAASDNQWSTPANWNTNAVPGIGDDVLIPQSQSTPIIYDTLDTEINSLFSNAALNLSGGTLSVDHTIQVNNNFKLTGATLENATILPGLAGQGLILTSCGGTLTDVTADAQIDGTRSGAYVTVINDLDLNNTFYLGDPNSGNTATLYLATDNASCARISGDGIINFGGSGGSEIYNTSGGGDQMLTIGSNITIEGSAGIIQTENGFIQSNGLIEVGALTVNGDFTNNGQLYPGGDNDPGTITVNGNFTQTAGGATHIDIGGPGATGDFDQINITGQANLSGSLIYTLNYGYQPLSATQFQVLTYDTLNGAFDSLINGGTGTFNFTSQYNSDNFTLTAFAPALYVDANSTASTPDGASWATAFPDLQSALALAVPGDTIDVAGGTYLPGTGSSDTFNIPTGVSIYGGFAGSADYAEPFTRDFNTYTSFLSGDLGPLVSAYNVLTVNDATGVRIDGFTIENGYSTGDYNGAGLTASDSSLTIVNCTFFGNHAGESGGAIYLSNSSATITDSSFVDNSAPYGSGGAIADIGDSSDTLTITGATFFQNDVQSDAGGAIYLDDIAATIVDCTFAGNSANQGGAIAAFDSSVLTITNSIFVSNAAAAYYGDGYADAGFGGAIAITDSSLTISNSTLSHNSAQSAYYDEENYYASGGAVSVSGTSTLTVTNSILWNDSAYYNSEIGYDTPSAPNISITYTDIEDDTLATGQGDFNADPQFIRDPGTSGSFDFGDLHLQGSSPAIDAGSNAAISTGITTDLDGSPRISDGTVDLGAYEAQFVYVDLGATGNNDGTSWTNAYTNLQDALNNASSGTIIDVAGGTYTPTSGTDRSASFVMGNGIAIFGGFNGSNNTSADPNQRDPETYVTTLSGNIGSGGFDGDNSYNVLIANGDSDLLDGLSILHGNADGSGTNQNLAGGISIVGGSLNINDCIISNNVGASAGGIYDAAGALTVTDSSFNSDSTNNAGGAVYLAGVTASFTDCDFANNTSPAGGAIAAFPSTNLTITGGSFTDDTASVAGGVIYSKTATLNISGAAFAGNSATNSSSGGAIYFTTASAGTITDCQFNNNSAQGGGGAAVIVAGSAATFTSCSFTDNSATAHGGAVDSSGAASASFTNCIFTGNVTATSTGGAIYSTTSPTYTAAVLHLLDDQFDGNSAFQGGGAVWISASPGTSAMDATNCSFVGNTATNTTPEGYGGAVVVVTPATAIFVNSTFIANQAATYGGALDITGTASLTNCILWNNTSGSGGDNINNGGGTLVINNSDFNGGMGGDAFTGNNNISADPQFALNPTAGVDGVWGTADDDYGDLRLLIGSPAIDSGDNTAVPNGITTDLAGQPRIIDAADTSDTADAVVDMGAYETNPLYVDAANGTHIAFSVSTPGDSWVDAFGDLSSAIAAAQPGQMIFVAGGTYTPTAGTDRTVSFVLKNEVSIFGGFAGSNNPGSPNDRDFNAYTTTLSGDIGAIGSNTDNSYHVLTAGAAVTSSTILDGVTVTLGNADGGSSLFGGGIAISNGSLTINDCIFTDNSASSGSGALDINGGFTADINGGFAAVSNTTFSDNTTSGGNGGAVGISFGGSGVFTNCTFDQNSAPTTSGTNGEGGAFYDTHVTGTLVIIDCTFTNNTSGNEGGALRNGASSIVQIIDCDFENNSSNNGGAVYDTHDTVSFSQDFFSDNNAQRGGAISNDTVGGSIENCTFTGNTGGAGSGGAISNISSSPLILDCVFNANSVSGAFADGGAIENSSSSPEIANCVFVGNSANDTGSSGGAIFNYSNSSPTIINCTFTQNSADVGNGTGGAIGNYMSSSPIIVNSILWNDSAHAGSEIFNIDAQSVPSITYSDVDGGLAGAGNVNTDPLLVRNPGANGPTDYGDLHLRSNSPVIDIGNNAAIPGNVTDDADGDFRIVSGTVDLGAYEEQVIYVDAGASGDDDGTSWTNAYNSLESALHAHSGTIILVAGGTYYPTTDADPTDDTDRTSTFDLRDGVAIFGGYNGSNDTLTDPNIRNVNLYPTYLSGDIGAASTDPDGSDNAYHVVYAYNVGSSAILSGVTIESGDAEGSGRDANGGGIICLYSDPTIQDCTITGNYAELLGGGLYNYESDPTITDCTFSFNSVGGPEAMGGAIANFDSSPQITSTLFYQNSTGSGGGEIGGAVADFESNTVFINDTFEGNNANSNGGALAIISGSEDQIINSIFIGNGAGEVSSSIAEGGAIYASNSSVSIINSTLTRNYSTDYGGAVYAGNFSNVTITNSILWLNGENNDLANSANNNPITLNYSDTDQEYLGTGDISVDPQFVGSPDSGTDGVWGTNDDNYGDLNLQPTSLAIDAGDNSVVLNNTINTDISGNPRIDVDGLVDMGPYEFLHTAIYVDSNLAADGDGTTWAAAYNNLADALANANAGNSIKIAGGTYTPTSDDSDVEATFNLVDGVPILGGFNGSNNNSDDPDTRDISLYTTTLSGDIGGGNHSYTVVYGVDLNGVRLDGLTISGGYAYGQSSYTGGGLSVESCNVTIANCNFVNNYAGVGGAIDAFDAVLIIQNSQFNDNSAHEAGGAIGAENSAFTVEGTTFLRNQAFQNAEGFAPGGGAISSTDSSTILLDCTFDGNVSSYGGAIADNANALEDTLAIINCVFVGNIAVGSPGNSAGDGGAIVASDASVFITDSTFTANSAVYLDGSEPGGVGGAVAVFESNLTITNSILWNDSAAGGSGGNEIYYDGSNSDVTITFSDIGDSFFASGGANTDLDPMFARNPSAGVDGQWGTADDDYGDLQLLLGSPAIDTGDNEDVPLGVSTDILGNPRIISNSGTGIDGLVDMGAYETNPIFVDTTATGNDSGVDWTDAYTSLSAALGAAQPGQMIFVAGGLYTAGTSSADTFSLVDGVGVFGSYGGASSGSHDVRDFGSPSVLSGNLLGNNSVYAENVVTAANVSRSAVLDGFFIQQGQEISGNGGGMLITNASPVISNCAFSDNLASNDGGAIFVQVGSPLIINSTFQLNNAGAGGGAIFFNLATPDVVNCFFENNLVAGGNGGAVVVDGATAGQFVDSDFDANHSDNAGGALYINASTLTIAACSFTGNFNTSGGSGGAIYASDSATTIANSIFVANTAQDGGAIADDSESSPASIINCTFASNSASDVGGALYVSGNSSPSIINSIFWLDTATNGDEINADAFSSVSVSFSDVDGGSPGANNFNSDPLFVRNPGTNNANDYGDLELQNGSPAEGTGDPSADSNFPTDIDGNPRVTDGEVNMGAYEFDT